MATLAELAALQTDLDEPAVDHLQRLVASWSLLSDLAFSDLLLTAPVHEPGGRATHVVVVGQVRPTNRTTLVPDDLVGTTHSFEEWPLVQTAYDSGTLTEGFMRVHVEAPSAPVWCVPVRNGGRVVAVLLRLQGPLSGTSALYEQSYLSIFRRLCHMVADGTFPYREDAVAGPGLPRVGDGVILIDAEGEVEFASPNAVNALHRLGIYTSVEGRTLQSVGLKERVVERALTYAIPALEEIDVGTDVAILVHGVPLLHDGKVAGVVTLVRDVSDLRRLNRVVLSKEAAVREVHHRVKNNLQTISSLLRLQARRSDVEETKLALAEAERRVRSIAVVHEVLSREPGEEVDFAEIVESVIALVEDTVMALHPVEIVVSGELGRLATDVATPLAVVLTELLTNAVEHAFAGESDGHYGIVVLTLSREGGRAVAEVRDNGSGLRPDFSLDVPTSLGLSIVRDLVRTQLVGVIEMRSVDPAEGGGTYVRVEVPLGRD